MTVLSLGLEAITLKILCGLGRIVFGITARKCLVEELISGETNEGEHEFLRA